MQSIQRQGWFVVFPKDGPKKGYRTDYGGNETFHQCGDVFYCKGGEREARIRCDNGLSNDMMRIPRPYAEFRDMPKEYIEAQAKRLREQAEYMTALAQGENPELPESMREEAVRGGVDPSQQAAALNATAEKSTTVDGPGGTGIGTAEGLGQGKTPVISLGEMETPA